METDKIWRFIVRDRATKGCDFLMWGDNDPEAARETYARAIRDGLDVELITVEPHKMDAHTRRLIEGA